MTNINYNDIPEKITGSVVGDKVLISDSEDGNKVKRQDVSEFIGPTGPAGVGVITGGTTGQVLAKKTNTDYDTEWKTPIDTYTKTETNNLLDKKATQNPGIDATTPILASDISINYTTRVLTITPPLGYFNYFTDGAGVITKHTITGNVSFPVFTNTSGIWYFYFDNSGNAVTTQTAWTDFNIIAPIYRILWNATLSPDSARSTGEAWECHENTISSDDHLWKHTYGAILLNGFNAVNNAITSGAPNADGRNTCFSMTGGSIMYDNQQYTITNGTGAGLWEQDLGIEVAGSLTISNGGQFLIRLQDSGGLTSNLPATRFPFDWNTSTNIPNYITTTGTRTPVSNSNFFVYFLYSFSDPRNNKAIKLVSATSQYTTLVNAQAVSWDTIKSNYPTLNDGEIRPLYRLIFEYRSSYNVAVKYTALREVTDYRKTIISQSNASVGSINAANVIVVPAGNISSTNAQSALEELDTEKVPTTRTLTINGTGYDLSADRSWTITAGGIWTAVPGTPTRASNTTFTITGDYTSLFAKGIVLKWTESSTVRNAMISIPSTYSSPNTTITIIGDTMASIDANSLKFTTIQVEKKEFAVAGSIGAVLTDVSRAFYALYPMRVIGADISVGIAGITNNTTVDINKNGTTMFTTKPTLATTIASSPTPFTADTNTSLALGDKITIDIDAFQTTNATDLYVTLYLFPTILNNQA